MSSSRDAKRKRHSTKKRRSIRSSRSDHTLRKDKNNGNTMSSKRRSNRSDGNSAVFSLKRRGLNINLSATPIKSLTKNTKKARTKPTDTTDITKSDVEPYNFILESQYKKSVNSRYRKRISAPIILPNSTTTPSISSMSTTTTTSTTTVTPTPNTPYYPNIANYNGVSNHSVTNSHRSSNKSNKTKKHKKRKKKKNRHKRYNDNDIENCNGHNDSHNDNDNSSNHTLKTNSNSNSNSNSNANTNYQETQIMQKPSSRNIVNNYSTKSITHSIQFNNE